MKAIVFGGSGFLGSHVADALTDSGHEVVIYDLQPSKYLCKGQKEVVGDILDEKMVDKAVKGCDVVYNFAGIADLDEAIQKPLDSVKFNVLGNSVILEACRKMNVKRFVFASSMYVYSKAGSFYRSAKQANELIIENYREAYGLAYTILRYGSLYGPRTNEKNYIHNVIREALVDGKITRKGDGDEIREYIHVYDAARCSVEILANDFKNQHVIITGNQQMKVKDLLLMIKEILDNKIDIHYEQDMPSSHYEITPYTFAPKLAKRIMSKTYFDLGQGILTCIQSMYKELNPTPAFDSVMIQDNNKKKPSKAGR